MLRAVVARVSGQDYETFTAEHVLAPMGIRDAHLDLMEGYHPNEVHRYLPGGKAHRGGHGDLKDGCGCWVLSPTDSMRFMTSLEGSRRPRVISQQAYVQMLAALPSLGVKRSGRHNGLGWDVVEPAPGGILYRKNGGVAGISTWMEHLPGDVCWALFFNARARDAMGEEGEDQPRKGTRKPPWARIREVLQSVERWPAIDLFESE